MSLDVYLMEVKQCDVFWSNITHNLGEMADHAGIYEALWEPEKIGARLAKDIIPILTVGLDVLKKNRGHFVKFNAKNNWGTYDDFVPWVEKYLEACKEHPDAEIRVSR